VQREVGDPNAVKRIVADAGNYHLSRINHIKARS
jgi:hypothetical protein